MDLDLDGKKDMILGGWYSDVRFYANIGTNASPVFTTFIYLVNPDSSTYSNGNPPRLNFTDWDGDGDQDMITCDYYGSVFLRRNISGINVEEHESGTVMPVRFSVTPSVIADRAVITVDLESATPVSIGLYAPDGRKVASLLDRHAEAGKIRLDLDFSAFDHQVLSGGTYFVVLKTNQSVRTCKVQLVH